MKSYRINQIFYSLQGEGANTGRAAVFVRFAGCNLRCPFCDTEFDSYAEMTASDIVSSIVAVTPFPLPADEDRRFRLAEEGVVERLLVVLTGGEPTLQVDEAFVEQLQQLGYEVAMESNGTRPAPRNLDWLTVSPKECWKENMGGWMENSMVRKPDELKIVFDENTPERLSSLHLPPSSIHHPLYSVHLYLQPCDTGDPVRNADIMRQCVKYIKHHPQWRLSLQTHKLIGIE